MAQTKLSADGIFIAKPGKDVETASLDDMLFTSEFPSLRVAMTGTVTLASYSGPMSARFARAIVNYPAPFTKPPIVLFAGITGAAETDQLLSSVVSTSGSANWTMASVVSYTDRFEMYGYYRRVDNSLYPRTTLTYRYFVFHNTLDDGT